ncbi:uncharacterized protein FIBRA_00413 [Fibroporia radiculosa]|uniref:Uncharacterized protein n=1 Tax=Fibroporia radiculosa TaxID=599839 RepID=J4I7X4_9APHY|nr:uncharacterized protein FIBRA_00413 [Fibroporia radiculosa]CCL98416.1 predicted protein [Fibroporia radiculosa]
MKAHRDVLPKTYGSTASVAGVKNSRNAATHSDSDMVSNIESSSPPHSPSPISNGSLTPVKPKRKVPTSSPARSSSAVPMPSSKAEPPHRILKSLPRSTISKSASASKRPALNNAQSSVQKGSLFSAYMSSYLSHSINSTGKSISLSTASKHTGSTKPKLKALSSFVPPPLPASTKTFTSQSTLKHPRKELPSTISRFTATHPSILLDMDIPDITDLPSAPQSSLESMSTRRKESSNSANKRARSTKVSTETTAEARASDKVRKSRDVDSEEEVVVRKKPKTHGEQADKVKKTRIKDILNKPVGKSTYVPPAVNFDPPSPSLPAPSSVTKTQARPATAVSFVKFCKSCSAVMQDEKFKRCSGCRDKASAERRRKEQEKKNKKKKEQEVLRGLEAFMQQFRAASQSGGKKSSGSSAKVLGKRKAGGITNGDIKRPAPWTQGVEYQTKDELLCAIKNGLLARSQAGGGPFDFHGGYAAICGPNPATEARVNAIVEKVEEQGLP